MRLAPGGRSALFLGLLVLSGCSSSSSNGSGVDGGIDTGVDSFVAPMPETGPVAVDAGVPSCTDGKKDQNETDIDCGGSCPSCPDGEVCSTNKDCQSAICTGGICQELPPPQQCTTTSDCTPSTTLCVTVSCTAGDCGDQFAPEGTTCSDNGGNTCDGAGNCTLKCTSATDCPAQTTKCLVDTCTGSLCGTSNAAEGTVCTDNSGTTCDGHGNCVACNKMGDCPTPTTACKVANCTANVCGTTNAASGTTCTDNGGSVCDAAGDCVACNSESDCTAQASKCMVGACTSNKCDATPAPKGTTCSDSGGTTCDATGSCVACNDAADCPAGAAVCQAATCVSNTCGAVQAPTGTACTSGGGKVCSSLGLCVECNVDGDCTTGQTCVANACVP